LNITLIPLHFVAGLLGLASGAVALYALKGGKWHRKSGTIFFYAMLVLSATGAVIASLKGQRFNAMQGVLTFYLVTTALLTARHRVPEFHWIDVGAMLLALMVGLYDVRLGVEALGRPKRTIDGVPAAAIFIFSGVALLAAAGDIRMMLARGLRGAHRIARHLWRMCFALFIAAGSLFLGQAQVFPEPLRRPGLLAVPVLLVLLLMVYWLVRVLFTQWRPRANSGEK